MNVNRSHFEAIQNDKSFVCFSDRIVRADNLTYQEIYKRRKYIVFICKLAFLNEIATNLQNMNPIYRAILQDHPLLKEIVQEQFSQLNLKEEAII